MHARAIHVAFFALAAASCGGAAETTSNPDASIMDAAASDDAGTDAGAALPCWSTSAPPDASPAEQLGVVGECCTTSDTCKSNSACVGGRCCIHLRDSGRRCTQNSDCCSGQCPTENDPDAGLISGECVPYP